jgi:hypothetical protein
MNNDYPPTFYEALYQLEHFNWQLTDSITDEAWELVHEHFYRLLHIEIDYLRQIRWDLRQWTPKPIGGAYGALRYTALVDYTDEATKNLGYGSGAPGDGEWDRVWGLTDKVFQRNKLLAVLGEIPREAWTTEEDAWDFVHGFVEEYLAYKTVEDYLLPNPWKPIIDVWEAGYLTLPCQPYSKRFDELKLILACKNEWREVVAFLPRQTKNSK